LDPRTTYDRRDEVQVLDVREPDEWATGHIAGAVHIPMNQVPRRLQELDPHRTVVVVCRSGHRSDHVAQYLRGLGINAENMPGGIQAWADHGLPLSR
jgi:rhodanese-related sulfurtransferase